MLDLRAKRDCIIIILIYGISKNYCIFIHIYIFNQIIITTKYKDSPICVSNINRVCIKNNCNNYVLICNQL